MIFKFIFLRILRPYLIITILVAHWALIYSYFQVAHLDFSEAHHPNFERLILYCLSSVGPPASHTYQSPNELVKKVALIDISVTIATKR